MHGEEPRYVFLGTHTDTPQAGSLSEPFSPKICDGSLFGKRGLVLRGRGAAAPKACLASIIVAAKAVINSHVRLRKGLIIGAYTRDLLANHDGIRELTSNLGLRISEAIVGEPSDNKIVVGARGRVEVEVKSIGRPVHAGEPDVGINPILKMSKFITALKDLALDFHPFLGRSTLALIDIKSEAIRPYTPKSCTLLIDRRILPHESPETVRGALVKICELIRISDKDFEYDVKVKSTMFPFEISRDSELVAKLREISKEVLGRDVELMYSKSFSSDAGYLQRVLSIPSVGFGPGRIEDVVQDHVEVEKLKEAASFYAGAIVTLCSSN
jgi:acetylornithine deacetylase/succinyl-diaminopimelate desuccinylase-like protein